MEEVIKTAVQGWFDKRLINIEAGQLKELFTSVKWAMQLTEEELHQAILNSSHMITYYENGKLVGLARSMDDGIYSANIDLVVVHKDYQGRGIAKQMILELLSELSEVRYVSVSPNESVNVPLYKKCGFKIIEDGKVMQLVNQV